MFRDGSEGMSTIPGLNHIQYEGFCRFIDQGLTEELYKFPKIEDTDQEIEFQLFVETNQLVEPFLKERDDVYESLTNSSELYVSVGLIWKTSRDMQEQLNGSFVIFFLLNLIFINIYLDSIIYRKMYNKTSN